MKAKSKTIEVRHSQEEVGVSAIGEVEDVDVAYSEMGVEHSRRGEWLINFEVNENGIGRILLPPTLSTLLQSDRISIVPSAGGLFIRSVIEY
jgi:hypothetical protein